MNGESGNGRLDAEGRGRAAAGGHFAAAARPALLEDPRARNAAIVLVGLLLAAVVVALAMLGAARGERAERQRLEGELARLEAASGEITQLRMRTDLAEARAQQLDQQVERLQTPTGGVPVAVVDGVTAGGEPALLQLGPSHLYGVLQLRVGKAAQAGLTARLRNRDGIEFWRAEGLTADSGGLLTLVVPAQHLPPGLIGAEVDGPVQERYRILVRAAG